MEFVFAYLAGLLTLINPCVIPVLPIVLASAVQADRRGPLALAAGMSLSFVVLGVGVTAFGHLIGLTVDTLAMIGAWMMIAFGLLLLVPRGAALMTAATSGLSARADAGIDDLDQHSLRGQFAGGALLGAVWSPCIGPTLGGAIALASQGQNLGQVTLIMTAFALGVSSIILGLAYGARGAMGRNTARLRQIAQASRPVLGVAFLLVGLGLLLRWNHAIEIWLLDIMPLWLIDLSVRF
ncbi:cytochrome c biogenesis CcdA family protein [Marivita sp. S6314]|uniref:cytochrome c biogenesis CcdA family protein n=1 Tax=Marivita sp. S6314 TaxID=2926406 RepID=UPI001FF6E5A1|nr:cytochrome c biogenesis CcdA family protein [Marivita sp. S6314]MCK0150042.1 cytochrome c biogenesis CcdA family protein [Marivita sp. S6314]